MKAEITSPVESVEPSFTTIRSMNGHSISRAASIVLPRSCSSSLAGMITVRTGNSSLALARSSGPGRIEVSPSSRSSVNRREESTESIAVTIGNAPRKIIQTR